MVILGPAQWFKQWTGHTRPNPIRPWRFLTAYISKNKQNKKFCTFFTHNLYSFQIDHLIVASESFNSSQGKDRSLFFIYAMKKTFFL